MAPRRILIGIAGGSGSGKTLVARTIVRELGTDRVVVSRELEDYRTPSPAARAALQLAKTGRTLRPGQRVRFLLTRGEPGIRAWDLPEPPDPRTLDVPRYRALVQRAAETVLNPMN